MFWPNIKFSYNFATHYVTFQKVIYKLNLPPPFWSPNMSDQEVLVLSIFRLDSVEDNGTRLWRHVGVELLLRFLKRARLMLLLQFAYHKIQNFLHRKNAKLFLVIINFYARKKVKISILYTRPISIPSVIFSNPVPTWGPGFGNSPLWI